MTGYTTPWPLGLTSASGMQPVGSGGAEGSPPGPLGCSVHARDSLQGRAREAASERQSFANMRMVARGGMRPFMSADEAAVFWHHTAAPLAGEIEFGSWIFEHRGRCFLGPVGTSFHRTHIDWCAFGPDRPLPGAKAIGFIHTHPNETGLSGQGEYVRGGFATDPAILGHGSSGDLGIAWDLNFDFVYASSGPHLYAWSRTRFLQQSSAPIAQSGYAFLSKGSYCLVGECGP
ncbi:MAG: hypothetical protein ACXIUZ_07125 [Lysobacteraceae bacterium]